MAKIRRSTTRRLRRAEADPLRKAGWQVHASVADAVRMAVEEGAAESQNAFVERALRRALDVLRRDRLYAAYGEAAQDPRFIDDTRSTTRAFDRTTADGLPPGA